MSVFTAGQAGTLLESDQVHWWFRMKAALVADLIARHAPAGRLVDLGAGAGGVTAALGRPDAFVVEGNPDLVAAAWERHRLPGVVASVFDTGLPDGCAAAVTLLDVIEHLDRPVDALAEARRLLQPNGALIVTVPAHQWLWSAADEQLGHIKRYDRATLQREVEAGGFAVSWCSHAFSWLVPPVLVRRRLRPGSGDALGLDATSKAIDWLAVRLCTIERRVVRRINVPVGTSVVAVARPRRPYDAE